MQINTPAEVYNLIKFAKANPTITEEDYYLKRSLMLAVEEALSNPATVERCQFTKDHWGHSGIGVELEFTISRHYIQPEAVDMIKQALRDSGWPYVDLTQIKRFDMNNGPSKYTVKITLANKPLENNGTVS
ncbi:hypothetical protein AVT69_gp240 [Pseudomonas phage PhiPA3]|uniref:Uncharacterized protein 242 n=1 Tax=Pseudomonas phage PhiPA3 TaxID=998086 RepID=F8SJ85_BPPA3|nr:hypothetical protein AVT69_gp240 [Pseudomonas phage PhiPA3]AEH03665.1 hypothetical protein [Pseudomonas phage PhiPA3]